MCCRDVCVVQNRQLLTVDIFWHLFWSYSPLVSVILVLNFCTLLDLFWSYSPLVSVILVFSSLHLLALVLELLPPSICDFGVRFCTFWHRGEEGGWSYPP